MESIYFALGAVAAALILHWAWTADRGGEGAYRGLLAMRPPAAQPAKDAKTARPVRR